MEKLVCFSQVWGNLDSSSKFLGVFVTNSSFPFGLPLASYLAFFCCVSRLSFVESQLPASSFNRVLRAISYPVHDYLALVTPEVLSHFPF